MGSTDAPANATAPASAPAGGPRAATLFGVLAVLATVSGLAACASGINQNALVVQWFADGRNYGHETLEIDANRRAHYTFVPGTNQPGGRIDRTATLTEADVTALRTALTDNGFCRLRPRRSHPRPDEAQPTLTVSFPSLQCERSLVENDWHDIPAARACMQALEVIRGQLRAEP